MKDGSQKKSKLSWSKTLVRKWFNIRSKPKDFQPDYTVGEDDDNEWGRTSFCEREACTPKKNKTERLTIKSTDQLQGGNFDQNAPQITIMQEYSFRIFAATWNVGGKSPPSYMNLEHWLHTSPPADIYVLGFQEIVPLNAGNVLGAEDNGPAKKWLALIRNTLNNVPGASWCDNYQTPSPVPNPLVELDADFGGSGREKTSSAFHRRSFQSLSQSLRMDSDIFFPRPRLDDHRFSVCDRVIYSSRPSDFDRSFRCSSDEENVLSASPSASVLCSPKSYAIAASLEDKARFTSGHSRYCLVASKQMVGIFLMVWVRSDLKDDVKNMKISCVGRGLMGYLGNKGSISISMSLHQTTFCFICSHLTSGQKDGDELRRNSDVMEILRKTRFPMVHGLGDEKSPETILEHDRVIWLGDLNYRIALSYHSAKALVEMHNWRALFESDQLQIEQKCGRIFEGWNEGKIYFPPTYKYSNNSDRYAGDEMHPKGKRRTPAWCDRILWYGRGLNQLSYVRGESRLSDHRPVYSLFTVEVESIMRSQVTKSINCSSSRVEVEELLLHTHGYTELSFF